MTEPVPPFGHGRVCELPFATTVERLRAAVEAHGLWVLHEINPQAIVARAGHEIGLTRQILFFHPDFMVRLVAADPAALLEAPLKFAVMELDGAVSVRWLDPAMGFARYGNAALAEVGRELEILCERIVDDALAPNPQK